MSKHMVNADLHGLYTLNIKKSVLLSLMVRLICVNFAFNTI